MFKPIIPLLLAIGLSVPALADTLSLRQDAPERYVVKKGDTLWDISARFLQNPWKWPQLWNMNRAEVRNPHLIYPGETLQLTFVDGKPRLGIASDQPRVVKLAPEVRAEPLESAIPAISEKVIGPFLRRPLLLENENEYLSSPRIIAGPDNRVILTTMDRAYSEALSAGGIWQAYRLGRTLKDPESGEVLGIEITYGGDLQVEKTTDVTTLSVRKIAEEILVGDRLIRSPAKISADFVPQDPPPGLEGRIVSSYGGVNEIGQQYTVLINRGKRDGVASGQVFGIYKAPRLVSSGKQQLSLPAEKVGRLMVFRVFDKASYALVLDASQAVAVKDRIAEP